LSVDGTRLVTIENDQGPLIAKLFDARSGRVVRVLPARGITSALFSPDGHLLVTTSADHTARIWGARRGRLLRVLRGHKGPVEAAAFSTNGKLFATASADGSTRVWNTRTRAPLLLLLGHGNVVDDVGFGPA